LFYFKKFVFRQYFYFDGSSWYDAWHYIIAMVITNTASIPFKISRFFLKFASRQDDVAIWN
jgi:hypothetical protein